MPPSLLLPVLFVLTTTCTSALAQTSRIFQWQFANNVLSTSLPTCVPFSIIVKPFNATLNDTSGVPPYYMIAFATGGTPSTTLIGTDNTTLSWTVTEPVGTQLMLSVVDSTGSAGGIPPQLYQVIAGQTTQCVTAPPITPEFTVTSNVTGSLTTCQPWGLTIKGGVPPYNLTLAAVNSPVVTNVTLPFGDDHFTYIDRADPNTQLLAAISDFTGRWATGTPILPTKGSTDVDCVGLVSSSGNSTLILGQEQAAASAANKEKKKKTSIIIGVSVSLGALLLFGSLTAIFFLLKRRGGDPLELQKFDIDGDVQWESTNGMPGSSTLGEKRLPALPMAPRSRPSASTLETDSATYRVPENVPSRAYELGGSPRSQSSSNQSLPRFASFPAQPTHRSTKSAAETSYPTVGPSDSEYPHEVPFSESGSRVLGRRTSSMPSIAGAHGPSPGGPRRTRPMHVLNGTNDNVGFELGERGTVFQHRDAGVVRELPPPYMDSRSRQATENP